MRGSKLSRALLAILVATTMTFTTVAPASGILPMGSISGEVVNETGDGLENITVYLQEWVGDTWDGAGYLTTSPTGNYEFTNLNDGDYRLIFDDDRVGLDTYAYEYYDDAIDEIDRTSVAVTSGAAVTGINATLAAGGSISGRVKNERGEGLAGVTVRAYFEPADGALEYRNAALTDADGYYSVVGLPADSYILNFKQSDTTMVTWETYNNKSTYSDADRIPLTAGEHLTEYNAVMEYTDQTSPMVSSDIATSYAGSASIEITSTDEGYGDSGIYQTYYDLDGAGWVGVAASTVVVDVDQLGEHSITYKAKDNAWNYSEYITKTFTITRDDEPVGDEVAGDTRYSTAIAASQEGFADDSASAVVIATGTNWPDALGGSALAGALGGPLLLTTPSALPSDVEAEIIRVGATEAYIVGGLSAVTQDVEDSLLELLGDGNVTRLSGDTRYETADEIAAEVIAQLGGSYDGNAFCATGGNFPDALAASSIAAKLGWPILLTPYGGNPTLPAETSDVVVLGGTSAVAASTETWLVEQLTADHVDRIAGDDRYDTGAQIAEFGIDQGLFWDGVGIAVGDNFPDALSGGAMLGSQGTVLLLTPGSTLSEYAASLLGSNKAFIERIRFLGGTSALTMTVRGQALSAVE